MFAFRAAAAQTDGAEASAAQTGWEQARQRAVVARDKAMQVNHMCTSISVSIYTVYVCMYVHVCMYVGTYVGMCVYTSIHTHIRRAR